MAKIEETEMEVQYDISRNKTSLELFTIGSEVEVSSDEIGYRGAWYEATIIPPPKSKNPSPNPSSSSQKQRWGFWVEHKHLLADKGYNKPHREYIRRRTLLRPPPPPPYRCRSFEVNDVVDAFYLEGWWTGVVLSVCGDGDFGVTGGERCRFRVGFTDPDEEVEFSHSDLRAHLDWVDGKWVKPVRPPEKMVLRPGSLGAAKDSSVKRSASSMKKEDSYESRRDAVQPAKKIKRKKDVKAPLITPCKGNSVSVISCKAAPVDEVAAEASDNQHSPRCLVSSEMEIDSSRTSTKNLPDQGSLAVPKGVEKQVFGSTLHNNVNKQNATSQAKLTPTDGKFISAGASATAVQSCVETSHHQPNGMPNAALGSVSTPVPSLPFRKYSTVWRAIESLEIFAKAPQNPHFSPLAEHMEEKREELALQKMMKYAMLVEKISKLTTADLKTSTDINDILAPFKDLEVYGFDVMSIQHCLNDLLLNKEKQTHLRNKLEGVGSRIRNCNLEEAKAEEEVNNIAVTISDLEKKLMSAKKLRETKNQEVRSLRSEEFVICDEIGHVQLDFEGIAASMKQIYC